MDKFIRLNIEKILNLKLSEEKKTLVSCLNHYKHIIHEIIWKDISSIIIKRVCGSANLRQ